MNESDMTGKKRRKHVQTPDITNQRRPLKIVILAIIVIAVLGNLYEEHKYDIEYTVGDAVQGVFRIREIKRQMIRMKQTMIIISM